MKRRKICGRWFRGISILLSCLLLAGCGSREAMTMEEAAREFAAGKTEVQYIPVSAEELLMIMLDDFSGSYYDPIGQVVDPDEFEDVRKRVFGDEDDQEQGQGSQDQDDQDQDDQDDRKPAGPAPEDFGEIQSETELEEYIHEVLRDTGQYFTFSSQIIDEMRFLDEFGGIYRDLQREDPIYVCCLKAYSVSRTGNEISVILEYTMDRSELNRMKAETPALVRKAAAAVGQHGSDYDKVFRLNQYLCDTVYYPDENPDAKDPNGWDQYPAASHTAYGALKDGCAVCEGYACAAALILRELEMEADIESGDTSGGGHAWNLVKVDGDWYQLDVTWNDCGTSYNPDAGMTYFLVTDDYMMQSRIWEYDVYPSTPDVPYTP